MPSAAKRENGEGTRHESGTHAKGLAGDIPQRLRSSTFSVQRSDLQHSAHKAESSSKTTANLAPAAMLGDAPAPESARSRDGGCRTEAFTP
jgi:hypothetical protein